MKKVVTVLFVSLTCSLFFLPQANSDDQMWWETSFGYSGTQVNNGTNINSIPLYARLRDVSLAVPKLNPDILIVGIRFDQRFDSEPLAFEKKLISGIRIWSSPSQTCIYDNKCDQVIYLESPRSWGDSYPSTPTSAQVPVYKIAQNTSQDNPPLSNTFCPAPWWIDTSGPHDAIKFQLSITCLGVKADIYSYAFAAADIGINPMPANFTSTSGTTNPYWQLAANAYIKSGGQAKVGIPYLSAPKPEVKYLTCLKGSSTKYVKIGVACPKGFKKGKVVTRQVSSGSV